MTADNDFGGGQAAMAVFAGAADFLYRSGKGIEDLEIIKVSRPPGRTTARVIPR